MQRCLISRAVEKSAVKQAWLKLLVFFISIINTLRQNFKGTKWYFFLCEEHIKVIPIGGGRRGYRE